MKGPVSSCFQITSGRGWGGNADVGRNYEGGSDLEGNTPSLKDKEKSIGGSWGETAAEKAAIWSRLG